MEYFLFSVLIISVIGYSIYLITNKKENTDAKVSDANNSIKFEAIKNSSNEHENKSDFKESFSFKGKGTKNPTLINVYNELQKRLDIWRERYSEFEYPNRIVINMIYQSLQLEVIWNNLNDFTSKPFYQDYNQANLFVENEKNKFNSNIRNEVENKYEEGGLIGNLNIDVYKELVAKAQKGDIVALEKIIQGFLWYSGAFELGIIYCSSLKNGKSHQFALDQICEIQTGINMNNLTEIQTLFGNNISLLLKKKNVLNRQESWKKEKKKIESVEEFVSKYVTYLLYKYNLNIIDSDVELLPELKELEKGVIANCYVDDGEKSFVWVSTRFRMPIPKVEDNINIYLCWIAIERDNFDYLLDKKGNQIIEIDEMQEELETMLERQVLTVGAISIEDKIFRKFSFIVML